MALTRSAAPSGYIPALDGLRGIAALLVVFVHSHHLIELPLSSLRASWLFRFSLAGDMGVDLFFVLSGYLISSILLESVRRPGGLRVFWARRVLRIFPLYYTYLALLVLLHASTRLFDGELFPASPLGWLGFFAYLSNFSLLLNGAMALELIVLWSLAIEEQFYLLWPLLVRKHSRAELARLALALIPLAALLRYACARVAPNTDGFYFLTFCRMDALLVGCLLALGFSEPVWRARLTRLSRGAVLLAVVAIVYMLQEPVYHQAAQPLSWIAWHYTATALAWGIVVCRALEAGALGRVLLGNAPLRFLGRISYGLYLWHPLLLRLVKRACAGAGLAPEALLAVQLGASIAVATASYYAIERPFLKLKARFRYPALAA